MKKSKGASAKARLKAAVEEQEKRLDETWYGKLIPNDYEEYRKLVDPSPGEIANAVKLDVLGRIVTLLYVSCFCATLPRLRLSDRIMLVSITI